MCLPNILFPVFMFAFIFHCRSFSPCWPLAFLILSPPLWLSMFFSYEFSITRSRSFSVIHVSVHIKKERRKRKDFFLSKSPGDHVISFQKNLELHFGSYTYWLSYFTLVCLWCGRTVARSVYGHVITKFAGMGRLPLFLSYGAPPTRALRARVELRYYF